MRAIMTVSESLWAFRESCKGNAGISERDWGGGGGGGGGGGENSEHPLFWLSQVFS